VDRVLIIFGEAGPILPDGGGRNIEARTDKLAALLTREEGKTLAAQEERCHERQGLPGPLRLILFS